jgi:hypothetical protein
MSAAADSTPPMIVHNVFFTLHDNSPAARQKLVEACRKYLTGHPGEVYFSAGVLCDSLKRPVNDLGYDVSLHVVFRTMADHDAYQQHPRHLEFISASKPNWKQVRVFDSEV